MDKNKNERDSGSKQEETGSGKEEGRAEQRKTVDFYTLLSQVLPVFHL